MAPPTHLTRPLAAVTPVAYVVVFSELSPRAKTQYARFLVENNVQFAKRPSDGRFVANVHLETPQVASATPPTTGDEHKLPPRSPRVVHAVETQSPEPSDGEMSDCEEAIDDDAESVGTREDERLPTQLRRYAAFLRQFGSSVSSRQYTGTYAIESKLVRLMSDIYDARSGEFGASPANADSHDDAPSQFAIFVRAYLKNRFGLNALVEQQALELTQGLAQHSSRQNVELFSRFLDGEFDEEALAFFLRARKAAQQELSIASAQFRPTSAASARRRGSDSSSRRRRSSKTSTTASPPTWLSKQQIESIAQRVFGAKNDDDFLQFVHNVRSFVVEHPATRTMEQLLEFDELLTVAVETFVNLQPLQPSAQSVSLSSTSKQAHDGNDLIDSQSSPSPSPLPPPPLPRSFGNVVTKTTARRMQPAFVTSKPVKGFDLRAPPVRLNSPDEKPKKPHSDEVDRRLSSLLARIQQRQLQGGA